MSKRQDRVTLLKSLLAKRILIMDGSWGAMIQLKGLTEEDFRGERFAQATIEQKGNNDILTLTQPHIITELHDAYYSAGADISETNTFSSTTIAQEDYGLSEQDVIDLNVEAARLGRAAADRFTAQEPEKPRFVAGSIGPLNKMLSMSADVNDPGARALVFDEVYAAYRMQIKALNEGGVDLYLIETITDTLNCKAAIKAIRDLEAEGMEALPIWISGTITDRSGRTLSGQTVEAFWNSVRHADPLLIGLNCALGANLMRPFLFDLARVADTHIAAFPNAGLPNAFGEYEESPDEMGAMLSDWAREGGVNVLGGCCGSTPDHIREIAKRSQGITPRKVPEIAPALRLSGLEPFELA